MEQKEIEEMIKVLDNRTQGITYNLANTLTKLQQLKDRLDELDKRVKELEKKVDYIMTYAKGVR